jgi:trypsin-like peptidase
VRTPFFLTLAAVAAAIAPLSAQQRPTAAPMSLETIRKAVVTIHALDADGQAIASGTGFFVAPEGMVVTAAHVLADAAGCSIELSDGETMRCTVAASDTAKDVMMLMVPGTAPAMLHWGSSAAAKDGDDVTVVSNPLGQLPGTLSRGIISASRVVGGTKLFQISAPISHGSSGGPLLNSQSQVIGVIRSTIESGQSLNFATATDAMRNLQMDPAAVAEAQTVLHKPVLAERQELPASDASSSGTTHSIGVGQSVAGALSDNDELYPDTSYYQRWSLITRPNQPVTIDLTSSDFDPVLIVRGAADSSLVNDDGGPGCASRVSFTAPSSGPFTILVNTTASPHRQTGRFTLAVSSGRQALDEAHDCQATIANAGSLSAIAIGESKSGSLTSDDELYPDTTYYQRWQFSARPGQSVTIDLSSADFDPVLIVRGTADTSIVNDDGGPGCASRVAFTASTSGPFTVLVNTTSSPVRQTGRYTLSITPGLKPVDPRATRDSPGDCTAGRQPQTLREIPERPHR